MEKVEEIGGGSSYRVHEDSGVRQYRGVCDFLGIALIEALQKGNWLEAGLFLALGVLSLWADFQKS